MNVYKTHNSATMVASKELVNKHLKGNAIQFSLIIAFRIEGIPVNIGIK